MMICMIKTKWNKYRKEIEMQIYLNDQSKTLWII